MTQQPRTPSGWDAACEAFEAEMWPKGPASGSGSGVWAAHKDRLHAAAQPRLSVTRQPPIAPELWRDAYARIAGQYAVLLERYDLAEDATAEDIIAAALSEKPVTQQPRTPTTEAGRRLIAWLGTQSAETFAEGFTVAAAIEAEARADLLAQIEKAVLSVPGDSTWPSYVSRAAVLAAIRSAAPK